MYEENCCEVSKTMTENAVATYADRTTDNINEAHMVIDELYSNLFGPSGKVANNEAPKPPVQCLKDALVRNAESSAMLTQRLADLRNRLFG